ncbi:GGDEF domain-containing protein [Peptococcaceae bacterium]|nr:GGDEF domain-containing protein [Peptococcaceae bacterium]
MQKLKYQDNWNTVSTFQLFGSENLTKLKLTWPETKTKDFLTGLPDRQAYTKAVELAQNAANKQNAGFGIIIFDLDEFKVVNDTYGHAVGDEVLKIFAKRAQNVIKHTDYLARYGGEEFVLLTTCWEKVFEIGERVRKAINVCPFAVSGVDISISASFGCAVYPVDGTSIKEVFEKADKALYQAKKAGRNRGA